MQLSYIRERGLKMGSLFYANTVFSAKSDIGQAWSGVSGINSLVDEFADKNKTHEKTAKADEKVDMLVDSLMTEIKSQNIQ